MSMKDEQTKNFEDVVEVEATVELDNKEVKKAKMIAIAKKVGKVAGVIGIGVLGYYIGSKVGKNLNDNVTEIVDVVLEDK